MALDDFDPIIDLSLLDSCEAASASIEAWNRLKPAVPAPARLKYGHDEKQGDANLPMHRRQAMLSPHWQAFSDALLWVRMPYMIRAYHCHHMPVYPHTHQLPWDKFGPCGVWIERNFTGTNLYTSGDCFYLNVAWFTLRPGEVHVAICAGVRGPAEIDLSAHYLSFNHQEAWGAVYPQREERLQELREIRADRLRLR